MFDSENWNVDHVASSLDTSLFGPVTPKPHKHKKKIFDVSESKPNQSAHKRKLSENVTPEPKKKKRKKKGNSRKVSADDNSEVKVLDKNIWKVTLDNENKPQNVKTKKKRKRKAKHDNVNGNIKGDLISEKDSPKKLMKNKTLNEDNLEENHSTKGQSNVKNEKKAEHKKKRKRKKNLEKSTEPEPKKTKGDQLEKTSLSKPESGQMSRKERRNKRKKKNSKKNKYKHLALASQEGRAVPEKNVSDLTLIPADSKGDHAEVEDTTMSETKSAADPGLLKKKKKKLNRRLSFPDETRSPSESDGIIDIPKILTSSMKGKKKRTGEVRHIYSLPGSCSDSEAPEALKTQKVSKKQNFDVTKLREIMSSEEKKIKDFIQEEVKMSAKKKEVMSGKTLNSPVGKGEKQTSPGNVSKKKHKDSAKQKEKMKNEGKQAKTPVKYGFDVTKLKEVMGSERKTMEALDQDFEKKKKKKEKDGGEKSLKEKMQERLNAARFRYLNEQLYTTTGAEAAELFADDDDAFQAYHQGYESQVSKWPVDPLTVIVKQIKSRHNKPDTVIADMGCGSARLAQRLTGVKVHSFDLVAVNKLVTACNMSEVPLDDGTVDVVVFCLSLMGTNLVDYLLEANRILKNGGTMKIAEVESRFKKVGAFVSKVEKLGFEVITKDLSNKMFYLFDFKKVKTAGKFTLSPKIELDPCVYKKR